MKRRPNKTGVASTWISRVAVPALCGRVARRLNVLIPAGASSATFTLPILGNTTVPTSFRLYASDGTVSRSTTVTVTPVVLLSSVFVNAVEGGFSSDGTVALNIPTQAGGAVVTLSSGDSNLLTLPASITLPQFYTATSFLATTKAVPVTTTVPISATFNGTTVTSNVTLNPAPVLSLTSVPAPSLVGGQSVFGTVSLNTFPRDAAGATVTLVSCDPGNLQVPATVLIPQASALPVSWRRRRQSALSRQQPSRLPSTLQP